MGGFLVGTGQLLTVNGGKGGLSVAGNKRCLLLSCSLPDRFNKSCLKCEKTHCP